MLYQLAFAWLLVNTPTSSLGIVTCDILETRIAKLVLLSTKKDELKSVRRVFRNGQNELRQKQNPWDLWLQVLWRKKGNMCEFLYLLHLQWQQLATSNFSNRLIQRSNWYRGCIVSNFLVSKIYYHTLKCMFHVKLEALVKMNFMSNVVRTLLCIYIHELGSLRSVALGPPTSSLHILVRNMLGKETDILEFLKRQVRILVW